MFTTGPGAAAGITRWRSRMRKSGGGDGSAQIGAWNRDSRAREGKTNNVYIYI